MSNVQNINNGQLGGPVRTTLNSWASQINQNTSDISTNTTNISTNTSNIATNTAAIAQNTSDISTAQANIINNTNAIAGNTTSINNLTSSLSTKQNIGGLDSSHDLMISINANYVIQDSVNVTFLYATTATDINVTIPVDSSIPTFAVGKSFKIYNDSSSAGKANIVASGGVTLKVSAGLSASLSANNYCEVKHLDVNTWVIIK